MSDISKFDLISGADISYKGICLLHPPHLDDIRRIGFDEYNSYIGFLTTDLNKYLSVSDISTDAVKGIPDLRIFDIWISTTSMREHLKNAFSFFISGKIKFVPSYNAFKVTCGETIGIINRNNYLDVVSGILNLNCVNYEQGKQEELIFQDEESRKLYEQIQKAKKTGELKSEDKNFSLANLISSVASFGNGYNLINIWGLTVYQLYDQFYRLNSKFQLDIVGTRWAAWGKEDFDFDVWHKDITLLK